jgi:hypothetical protein
MAVNRDKPGRWKTDVAASVDMYNEWFMKFAPKALRGHHHRAAVLWGIWPAPSSEDCPTDSLYLYEV